MPHSHHSHSGQFCRHAKDTLEQVIQEAIRQKFEVFGLSEHAPRYRLEDLFPEESDLTPVDLEKAYFDFLEEAIRIRTVYSDRISLLIGLETDYITGIDLSKTVELLEKRKEIDYIVGSVHHVNGISIDFDKPTWTRAVRAVSERSSGSTMTVSPNSKSISLPRVTDDSTPSMSDIRTFLLAYFDAQYEMLRTLQPEVVGHIDLCLLWTPDISLRSSEMEGVWQKVERNVEFAVQYGALFEANAAAIRKGWKTSYPNSDILQLILERRGRICLSDDSHGISYVGLNYSKMRQYLVDQGVKEVWYLVNKAASEATDSTMGPRDRVKARKLEKWSDHDFWTELDSRQADR